MTASQGLSQWATWTEILRQPDVWRQQARSCDFAALRQWIDAQGAEEIWFCGSGTSAYIGDILAAGLEEQRGTMRYRSVPATDLVARPQAFLKVRAPLVVNFGRSGNSAETLGTLDALDTLAPQAPRLNITCNESSQLAARTRDGAQGRDRCIVLPEAAHDSGFAMTSSFSTMLLTALALLDDQTGGVEAGIDGRFERAAQRFEAILPAVQQAVGTATAPPARVAFIGTGPLAFAARESALKVMELSAGRIACLWDSVLGFRHGPKSFVDPDGNTLLVVFTGYDGPASTYEADLIAELRAQFPASRLTIIGPKGDVDLSQPDGPLWSVPHAVLFSQVASVMWADGLCLNVDDPFEGKGTLTRVVDNVRLYEVTA